ncbi:MAG: extracellular solute-binding protein [Anaerolineae bacterium]
MLRWNCLCLLVLAALLVAGCGAKAPSTPTPQPLQIRFVYSSELLTPHYERLTQDFEATNPRFDVVLQASNPYSALGAVSNPADVAEVDQLGIVMLAQAGLLRPLEPLLQGSPQLRLETFYGGTIEALRWQGQLWGLPAGADPWMLYYNKDIFDSKGLSYPTNDWTWDDLLNATMRIADPTADPPIYGIIADMARADFVPLVYQNGGTLVDSLVDPRHVTFTDPATVEAVEWYVGLAINLGVMPTPEELRRQGGFDALVTGQRGAMWYGPLSERGGMAWGRQWPFQWGVVAPPGNRARMTLVTMRAYVLGAKSERIGPAWEWLQYLALHPSTSFDVPPIKEVAESDAFTASLGPDVAAATLEAMRIGHTIPATAWVGEVANWLGEALTAIFEGQMTAMDALTIVQERAETLLAQQGTG